MQNIVCACEAVGGELKSSFCHRWRFCPDRSSAAASLNVTEGYWPGLQCCTAASIMTFRLLWVYSELHRCLLENDTTKNTCNSTYCVGEPPCPCERVVTVSTDSRPKCWKTYNSTFDPTCGFHHMLAGSVPNWQANTVCFRNQSRLDRWPDISWNSKHRIPQKVWLTLEGKIKALCGLLFDCQGLINYFYGLIKVEDNKQRRTCASKETSSSLLFEKTEKWNRQFRAFFMCVCVFLWQTLTCSSLLKKCR